MDKYCVQDDGDTSYDHPNARSKRARVQIACDICHKQKIKCNGLQPCQNCDTKNNTCTYERSSQRRETVGEVFSTDNNATASPKSHNIEPSANGDPAFLNTQLLDDSFLESFSIQPSHSPQPSAQSGRQDSAHTGTICAHELGENSLPLLQAQLVDLPAFTGDPTETNDDLYLPDLDLFDSFETFFGGCQIPDWIDADFNPGLASFAPYPQSTKKFQQAESVQEVALQNLSETIASNAPCSLSKQVESWLRLPLVPREYDLDVIETLNGICHRHLSPVFESFKTAAITENTLSAQLIAMAALGALFTSCAGKDAVARFLFTDSQRMVNQLLVNGTKTNRLQLPSLLKTMLVLELFGLCSGLKRSNETGEAYHQALIQISKDYYHEMQLSNNASGSPALDVFVLEDLLILESYRVILQQLQPIPSHYQLEKVESCLRHLRSCSKHVNGEVKDLPWHYHELACIAIASYFTTPYAEDLVQTHTWKPEMIEIYTQCFANQNEELIKSSHSLEILLRTNLWTIRSPIDRMQKMTFGILQAPNDACSLQGFQYLCQWRRSDDYPLVVEHVNRVLDLAEGIVSQSSGNYVETPHDAICTYLGTLALWTSCFTSLQDRDVDKDCRAQLERGMATIKRFRVSLASTLSQILGVLFERLELDPQEKRLCRFEITSHHLIAVAGLRQCLFAFEGEDSRRSTRVPNPRATITGLGPREYASETNFWQSERTPLAFVFRPAAWGYPLVGRAYPVEKLSTGCYFDNGDVPPARRQLEDDMIWVKDARLHKVLTSIIGVDVRGVLKLMTWATYDTSS
ncbi:hypothetical protein MMC13_006100 [Lambiella insularis]|nr:hypothetical protein [Lambiella insularis]